MNELEILEIQIKDLENACDNVIEAMNNIKDVDGLDEEYKSLDLVLYAIDDLMVKLKVEQENLEDEAMYKENAEKWKREHKNEYYEYRKGAL